MAEQQLNRGLKNRHLQMIALGTAVGTGLFYGSTSTIALAGPAVSLSYLIGGVFQVHSTTMQINTGENFRDFWQAGIIGFYIFWRQWLNLPLLEFMYNIGFLIYQNGLVRLFAL